MSAISVALFTRAWIEISRAYRRKQSNFVALFTRAWIEMRYSGIVRTSYQRRPLHEGVD